MPDREKVIEGLQKIIDDDWMWKHAMYYASIISDAVKLLKEQEAIDSMNFGDKTDIMANLEGLTWDDWHMYHSDTEVQNIAKSVFDLLIALLKKQEAVEPIKQIEQTEWTVCGNCHKHLISKWTFCPYCGKAVKWE